MSVNTEEMIDREAAKRLRSIFERISALEENDYFRILYAGGHVSNPPTKAEITGIFGAPGTFNGIAAGLIKDKDTTRTWFVVTDDVTDWFYVQLTKAL